MGEEDNSSTAGAVSAGKGSGEVSQPRPWRIFRGSLVDANGEDVVFTGVTLRLGGGALAQANTHLALTACNAHHDLKEALEHFVRIFDSGGTFQFDRNDADMARAALSKANGA